MTVFIEDSFDSAHWLPNVPDGHKCKALHGHTYKIRIEVTGSVGKNTGWVVDYAVVKTAWMLIKEEIDHKCLNDIPGLENSTCERVAELIFDRMFNAVRGVSGVELRETEHCGVVIRVK